MIHAIETFLHDLIHFSALMLETVGVLIILGTALRTAICAAKHSRDFTDAFFHCQAAYRGVRPFTLNTLFHQELMSRHRGNLRQMCNTDHLSVPCNHRHLLSHDLCHSSRNACIDLVEHHGPDATLLSLQILDCKHQAA